jgi:hypothetical protein
MPVIAYEANVKGPPSCRRSEVEGRLTQYAKSSALPRRGAYTQQTCKAPRACFLQKYSGRVRDQRGHITKCST